MNKDTLKLLQTRKNPINSMQDLHKRLIGTREGFIFYTTDFRKDFDTKIAMLGHLEQENQQLKDRDLIIAAELTKLQDENKILKENAENNDKVVDKVNWENMLLKKENKQLKDKLSKIETLIINHNCDTGDIYYKYNSKFLKSELKQRILEILYGESSDSNGSN